MSSWSSRLDLRSEDHSRKGSVRSTWSAVQIDLGRTMIRGIPAKPRLTPARSRFDRSRQPEDPEVAKLLPQCSRPVESSSLLTSFPAHLRLAPCYHHHILPLDLPPEPLGQPRPVPRLDEKGNIGFRTASSKSISRSSAIFSSPGPRSTSPDRYPRDSGRSRDCHMPIRPHHTYGSEAACSTSAGALRTDAGAGWSSLRSLDHVTSANASGIWMKAGSSMSVDSAKSSAVVVLPCGCGCRGIAAIAPRHRAGSGRGAPRGGRDP